MEVADDGVANFASGVVGGLQRELPFEVIGERGAGRERVLDRRQLFDFLRRARAVAVVEIIAEEVFVIRVVPRIVGLLLRFVFGFFLFRRGLGGLQLFRGHLFE